MDKSEILKIITEELDLVLEVKLSKGDLVGQDDEIGVVNKVKGRVAYVKFPSTGAKSFDPVLVSDVKYKGKFKGKDLYLAEAVTCSSQSNRNEEELTEDHKGESRMSKSQLFKMASYSKKIHDMLKDDMNLPEWVESKITKAADYLGAVKHYLEYEMERGESFNESTVNEARLPKRFTVKTKQTIDGTIYSPGDYALKKKRAGGGIYLNMDKGEMLGVDARNIATLEEGKLTEAKVSYNFSEEELKRVLQVLGRNASTEVKMIKAFEKALGRKLTRDELFEVIKEGKLTEAEDYKYKKYAAKAFKDIIGATFDFRHSMGIKTLTNKDMKLKKKADAIHKAIIDLQKEMKSKGLTEATSLWKHFDAKMKLQDEIMDIEMDMKNITATIKQLHKNMEQEAEPEGGKVADKYGRQLDKYEKMYKKRKAEFKKLMAKLDKMEQY